MNLEAIIWLTWRQHRWTIVVTAVIAVLAAYGLTAAELDGSRTAMPLAAFYSLLVQLGFGALIGAFWGAPLIARELEERTYFVAWGQDVTPVQWLRGKLLVLGAAAAVLGSLVGLGDGLRGADDSSWTAFEANWLVQAGYALLGLAIGVLAGLLTRHTFTAMAVTLVAFTLVRMGLAFFVRDHYLPVHRSVARWDQTTVVPHDALRIAGGFVDADLDPVDVPARCADFPVAHSCMRSNDFAIGTYADYQPLERLGLFRFIEFGICMVLAGLALYVTLRLLRHGGGWRPSRSHRRDVTSAQSTPAVAAAQTDG
ncbi:hypothetical protein BBK82_19030 [Lentzea guizhouensis]|uniref:ABC transporter permease n=1 Tax=Lentzea guizhouensis TaxID=1586287 RepID=A0A1B2HJE8_9PSEU|nr:hypothetical protein [Lentzea guizhouensis]ANZ37845.1 hypothetical protein BBK82_19030 [Lentzea guizhouensis]